MRVYPLFALMSLLALPAAAQTLRDVGVDSVHSGIGEESLAPAVLPVQKPRNPAAAVSSTAAAVTSATEVVAVVNPLEVKGVVVTLSDTTGFDRDAALEVAAKQSLPKILQALGHTPESAAKKVKSTGSAMQFVQGFKVVKESLIPVYTLTSDLTFNGPMVIKNFGGKMPVADVPAVAKVEATAMPVDEVKEDVVDTALVKRWVVRIRDRNPANVDKIRVNLGNQAGTQAAYRLLTGEGAELLVTSSMDGDAIRRIAGGNAEVLELQIDVPVSVAPAGATPWQGQGEPGVPAAPGAPQLPQGTY